MEGLLFFKPKLFPLYPPILKVVLSPFPSSFPIPQDAFIIPLDSQRTFTSSSCLSSSMESSQSKIRISSKNEWRCWTSGQVYPLECRRFLSGWIRLHCHWSWVSCRSRMSMLERDWGWLARLGQEVCPQEVWFGNLTFLLCFLLIPLVPLVLLSLQDSQKIQARRLEFWKLVEVVSTFLSLISQVNSALI